MTTERSVTYSTTNSYSTLNEITPTTKNIWVVCHGIGYLSRYFIDYFTSLDPNENYIIAPQAPSKYYQDKSFKYVGASWLTKENTQAEIPNLLHYLNAVLEKEVTPNLTQNRKLILFGYSQGVSIVTRWVAFEKISCDQLILHSGAIPEDLNPEDYTHLPETTPVSLIYGNQDEYIYDDRVALLVKKAETIFGNRLTVIPFEGKHEVNTAIIKKLSL